MVNSEKETWVSKEVDKPVQTESVVSPAKPAKGWLEQCLNFALQMMNVALTLFIAGLIAAGSYFAYPLLNQPSFTEAQAFLNQNGDDKAGEILSEMAKTCQNGAKTPHACKLLYYSRMGAGFQDKKKLSQAPEHSTVRVAQ